jgi:alpha-L-glutamate ligase-like protein/uncharacterized protein (TIGR02421 family)
MIFSKKSRQILGMNARNLHYIARYNSHADKKFADNKIFTKRFLESRGIGVAKLFHVVRRHTELTQEFFTALPDSFVLKPNHGFGGGGILVITEQRKNFWYTSSGTRFSSDDLFRHCIDILDGKYSISGVRDSVIFEERLEPHADLFRLTEAGLCDIRVIVFNSVPVMAMLRVPTHESDGKANMELGAYGMGIDLGTGKTIGAAYHSRFLKRLPNGEPAVGFQIPFWDEILHSSAKIQRATKIGYLGVDFVVTKTGVKVLELNARAGLKIQIANRIPLKPRLRKVIDLKIHNSEEAVNVTKTLFSRKIQEEPSELRPVIGIRENVILNIEPPENVVAKIDLHAQENIISHEFRDEISGVLDLTIQGIRKKLPVKKGDVLDADLVLAGKFLSEFFIDPNKKFEQVSSVVPSDVDERKMKNVDEKICKIDDQLKLLSYINPRNIEEQKDLFFAHPEFVPRFLYRECELDLENLRQQLRRIPEVDHVLFPLFSKKIQELQDRISLIESVGSDDFPHFSDKLFGAVTEGRYRTAVTFLKKNLEIAPDESEELDSRAAIERMEEYLAAHKLSHWKIKILEDSVADVQVTKKGSILLKKDAQFKKNRLEALLVHEIGTHVFRNENGKLQPFQIFRRGTAGYLQTEEGLAVHNQNVLGLELGEKYLTPALLMVAIFLAGKMSFRDLFDFLRNTYEISDDLAWKLCLKSKRGVANNSTSGAFTKDSIYFRGERDVQRFLKDGGTIDQLYVGKITTGDLKILKKFEDLKPAKFLP